MSAAVGTEDIDHDLFHLPPGFRFHPTDEELISHYLYNKVLDISFSSRVIGDVDLNKSEPWELPWKAKMGEKEWFFFCMRDRKYPTGLRTNRATIAGYWKATGKDKEIYKGKSLVGMKKTLVFYKGRAPRGEKSNWVMHEYRLEGKNSIRNLPKSAKIEWVICRVFQKSIGGKKTHISGLMRMNCSGLESDPTVHVSCFSNPTIDVQRNQQDTLSTTNQDMLITSNFNPIYSTNLLQCQGFLDQSILRSLSYQEQQRFRTELDMLSVSQETGPSSEISEIDVAAANTTSFGLGRLGPVDLDCLWNY